MGGTLPNAKNSFLFYFRIFAFFQDKIGLQTPYLRFFALSGVFFLPESIKKLSLKYFIILENIKILQNGLSLF